MACLYADMFFDGLRWEMALCVGNAMLMRGGACAAELCLMVGEFCCVRFEGCGLSSSEF